MNPERGKVRQDHAAAGPSPVVDAAGLEFAEIGNRLHSDESRQIRLQFEPTPGEVADYLRGGPSPFQGIELARRLTDSFERTLVQLVPEGTDDLAVIGYGSLGRREMVGDSDVDLLLIRAEGTRFELYTDLKKTLIHRLHRAGWPKVDSQPFSTVQEWLGVGRVEMVDAERTDYMRFLYGKRELVDELQYGAKAAIFDPELQFQHSLVREWYRLSIERRELSVNSTNLKLQPGAMRWGVLYLSKALDFLDPDGSFGRKGPHQQEFSCSKFIGQRALGILDRPLISCIANDAPNFLLWLRDVNFSLYHVYPEGRPYELIGQRRAQIAQRLGLDAAGLDNLLKRVCSPVLEAIAIVEEELHRRFSVIRGSDWAENWTQIRNACRQALQSGTAANQAHLHLGYNLDDPVLRLTYAWFSTELAELNKLAERLLSLPTWSAAEWPEIRGLARNVNFIGTVSMRLLDRLASAGFEWHIPREKLAQRIMQS